MKNTQNIPICNECASNMKSVFNKLTNEELTKLTFEKGCTFFKRNDIIYHEGNRPTGAYCLNKGIVKLYKTGIEGKEQIIRFAKKGDLIGYRSVLSGELSCTTAQVIEDAILCFIPGDTLAGYMKNNSDFSMEMMQMACRELGVANSFLTDIAQKTVRERLAEVLIYLKREFDVDEDGILKISLTREELANIVGTATESVIRLLSEFKSDKLIELTGRKIKILDEAKLKKTGNVYD
jgi:CRP-like cAMP-binding protein